MSAITVCGVLDAFTCTVHYMHLTEQRAREVTQSKDVGVDELPRVNFIRCVHR